MLEKRAKIKRFDKEDDFKKLPDKLRAKGKKEKLDLNYNRFNFNKYANDKKFDDLSFSSKFGYLIEFHGELVNLNNIKSI